MRRATRAAVAPPDAELPALRAGRAQAARLLPLGAPQTVRVLTDEAGAPIGVVFGRTHRAKRVTAIRERWRIDDEWWRRPLSREYASVVLEDGRSLTLYLDRIEGGWWVQGEEG